MKYFLPNNKDIAIRTRTRLGSCCIGMNKKNSAFPKFTVKIVDGLFFPLMPLMYEWMEKRLDEVLHQGR